MLSNKTIGLMQQLLEIEARLQASISKDTDGAARYCAVGDPQIWFNEGTTKGFVENTLGVKLHRYTQTTENNHYEFRRSGVRCTVLLDRATSDLEEAEADDVEPNTEA